MKKVLKFIKGYWTLILLAALLLFIFFGYEPYMGGDLELNPELYTDENYALLAQNVHKLTDSPAEELIDGWDAYAVEGPGEEALCWLYVAKEEGAKPLHEFATYNRHGVFNILSRFFETFDFSKFVTSTVKITVSNDQFAIGYIEPNIMPNPKRFETWFCELLETAQA